MKPKTPQQKATETYTDNKLGEGLVRVHPWIPTSYREAMLSLCQGLREGDKVMVKLIEKVK